MQEEGKKTLTGELPPLRKREVFKENENQAVANDAKKIIAALNSFGPQEWRLVVNREISWTSESQSEPHTSYIGKLFLSITVSGATLRTVDSDKEAPATGMVDLLFIVNQKNLKVSCKPLPLSSVAVYAKDAPCPIRLSAAKGLLPLPTYLSNLQSLSSTYVTSPPSEPWTIELSKQPFPSQLPAENSRREYKHFFKTEPTSLDISQAIAEKLFGQGLMNTVAESASLLIGIEDESMISNGIYYDLMSPIPSPRVFPPVPSSFLTIEACNVERSDTQLWPQDYVYKMILKDQTVAIACALLGGFAAYERIVDNDYALYTPQIPEKLLTIKSDYNGLAQLSEMLLDANLWERQETLPYLPPRVVLRCTTTALCRSDSLFRNPCFTLNSKSRGAVEGLNPEQTWLRLRKFELLPSFAYSFNSDRWVKWQFDDGDAVGGLSEMDVRRTLEALKVSPSLQRMPQSSSMNEQRALWRSLSLSVTSFSRLEEAIDRTREASCRQFLVLVPVSIMDDVSKILEFIRNKTVPGTMEFDIMFAHSAAWEAEEKMATSFHISAPKSTTAVWYSRQSLQAEELSAEDAKLWFAGKLSHPPWQSMIRAGAVVQTGVATHLIQEISKALTRPAITRFAVLKEGGGVGASTLLHQVAFEFFEKIPCLFVNSNIHQFTSSQLRGDLEGMSDGIILLFDEEVTPPNKLFDAVRVMPIPICIVQVRRSTSAKSSETAVILNGRLEKADVAAFGNALKRTCETKESIQALDSCVDYALESQDSVDRHMFVFCLAATQGDFKPAKEFIQSVYEAACSEDFSKKVTPELLSVAFVSAFTSHGIVPLSVSQQTASAIASRELSSMFDVIGLQARAVHPFFALLFLQCKYPRLCCEANAQLECWGALRAQREILTALLTDRGGDTFSPWVSLFVNLQQDRFVRVYVEKVVAPDDVHTLILAARLFRALSHVDNAVDFARRAYKMSSTGEILLTRHFLFATLCFARSRQVFVVGSTDTEIEELYQQCLQDAQDESQKAHLRKMYERMLSVTSRDLDGEDDVFHQRTYPTFSRRSVTR